MPIEVRELVIQGKMKGGVDNPNSLDDDRINELELKLQSMLEDYKAKIIKECMEEFEKRLRKQKQR